MKRRILPILGALAAFLAVIPADAQPPNADKADANIVLLGDADNNKTITLHPGDELSVALDTNPSTAYSWNLLGDPNSPLILTAQPEYTRFPHKRGVLASGGYTTYDFTVRQPAPYARSFYLRFLSLRPFDKGVSGARLWEIKVTVPAELAVKIH